MKATPTFTAIDFETAQGARNSICQVGLVRVEDGVVIDKLELLVQPPGNFYWDMFIDIHGIGPAATAASPTFDKVWNKVEPFIKNQNVVAHNGFAFDFPGLNIILEHYQIEVPEYTGHCTYQIYREALGSLCKKYQIDLDHHNALSDALACAKLFMLHQK